MAIRLSDYQLGEVLHIVGHCTRCHGPCEHVGVVNYVGRRCIGLDRKNGNASIHFYPVIDITYLKRMPPTNEQFLSLLKGKRD